jgi:hypothetical protein
VRKFAVRKFAARKLAVIPSCVFGPVLSELTTINNESQ